MKIMLNLPIKRQWLDMIERGEKREEYRGITNRQCARFYNAIGCHGCVLPDDLVVVFRNGYRMDSPALAVRILGMFICSGSQAKHPEWGEPTGKGSHIVIELGAVVARGTYAEVREVVR